MAVIKDTDLDAAVGEGIISRDQAMQLRDLAKRTAVAAGDTLDFTPETRDEPFRLLRGFRDVFIAIAVAIFAFGLSSLATAFSDGYNLMFETVGTAEDRVWLLVTSAAWVIVGVLLAEWITGRQRLPLASLVMSLAFAFWSMSFVTAVAINLAPDVFTGLDKAVDGATIWARIVGALLGLIFFYWRYRLPFTLLPLAAAAVFMGYSLIGAIVGETWAEDNGRYIIGVLGLCVFALAMWFDIKDRLRVTRFSECAFWLHLLAAPMLVHSILFDTSKDSAEPVVIFGIMAGACDRRAPDRPARAARLGLELSGGCHIEYRLRQRASERRGVRLHRLRARRDPSGARARLDRDQAQCGDVAAVGRAEGRPAARGAGIGPTLRYAGHARV